MITQASFTFPHAVYEQVLTGPYERPVAEQRWWGVSGAALLLSKSATRELTLKATLCNFFTLEDFTAAINTMELAKNAGLNGTLNVTGISYPAATFLAWEPEASPFWDGSGVHGWVQRGTLRWRQLF